MRRSDLPVWYSTTHLFPSKAIFGVPPVVGFVAAYENTMDIIQRLCDDRDLLVVLWLQVEVHFYQVSVARQVCHRRVPEHLSCQRHFESWGDRLNKSLFQFDSKLRHFLYQHSVSVEDFYGSSMYLELSSDAMSLHHPMNWSNSSNRYGCCQPPHLGQQLASLAAAVAEEVAVGVEVVQKGRSPQV